jgi:A/G-specific adenine glycosylase
LPTRLSRGLLAAMLKPPFRAEALQARREFREALADWFATFGKDYPWRRTRDPYAVLVSEVMLQQTQIATVLGKSYFSGFLEAFPDLEALAGAEDEPLLKAWEGLGYYRRARMLRDTARAVIQHHGGVFPQGLHELRALPGIGRYTAGAVRAFAFDLPAAVVDGNVARVLSRVMDCSEPVDEPVGVKQLWDWAEQLADPQRPRIFNSAIMELGQTLCRPGLPDCLSCPVASFCKSRQPEELPAKRPRPAVTDVDEHVIWLRDGDGRLLVHCEKGRRREGLWKLPTREPADVSELPLLEASRYSITRYRVSLRVYAGGTPAEGDSWVTPREVALLPMPSPFRKVVDRLFGEIEIRV